MNTMIKVIIMVLRGTTCSCANGAPTRVVRARAVVGKNAILPFGWEVFQSFYWDKEVMNIEMRESIPAGSCDCGYSSLEGNLQIRVNGGNPIPQFEGQILGKGETWESWWAVPINPCFQTFNCDYNENGRCYGDTHNTCENRTCHCGSGKPWTHCKNGKTICG